MKATVQAISVSCPTCSGWGTLPSLVSCPACKGTGAAVVQRIELQEAA